MNNYMIYMNNYFFSWICTACFRTIFGLFRLLLQLFYLIIRDSTYTFLASEMEFYGTGKQC